MFCLPYSPIEIVYIFSDQLPEGFLCYMRSYDHIPTCLTPLESWVGSCLNFIGYFNNSNHQDPLPPPLLDVVDLLPVDQESQTYSEKITNYGSSLEKLMSIYHSQPTDPFDQFWGPSPSICLLCF